MAGTRQCSRKFAHRIPAIRQGFWRPYLLKLDYLFERRLLAELRQCHPQFHRRIPDTHLHHRAPYLQKLKRNLDRPLLAADCCLISLWLSAMRGPTGKDMFLLLGFGKVVVPRINVRHTEGAPKLMPRQQYGSGWRQVYALRDSQQPVCSQSLP